MSVDRTSPREELAAQLLWEYVQRVREQPEAALTRGEVYELAETMALASTINSVVDHADEPLAREAVHSRLSGAHPPAARRDETSAIRAAWGGGASWLRRPAWVLAPLAGVALAAGLVFFSGSGPVHVDGASIEPAGVTRLSEEAAHGMVPLYVRGELDEQREKSVMWHLVRCRGCYRFYRSLRPQPTESLGPVALRIQ